MKTMVLSAKELKIAAELIKKGELVAFPTETVYGLGADAFNAEAVKKIFIAKGRPADNPLIVHIAYKRQLDEVAEIAELKPYERKRVRMLIKKFWPGPLTLVLKKKAVIPAEVTAGLDTVAVRMPSNRVAHNLIKLSGVPVAAPSANLSGRPSATCFEHVLEDFNGRIAAIVKSKPCQIGIESTVIDLSSGKPLLLRPGKITLEELKEVLPAVRLSPYVSNSSAATNISEKVKSPGMKYRHYSPDAKIILFEKSASDKIPFYKKKFLKEGKRIRVVYPDRIKNFARKLFSIFRQCDKDKVEYILISAVNEEGIGLALMNRIRKAAFRIVR